MDLKLFQTTYDGCVRCTAESTAQFEDDEGREDQLINLYPQFTYQTLDGFGGAITESAAYVYSLMPPQQKRQIMASYFGQENMKYRFVRIPIDSCDFSIGRYEAAGEIEDACFAHFSFERVEKYILPMLRDAEAAYGGKLEIMLSPWSPPAYMKTNGDRDHGGTLRPEYWKRWAECLCRYIEEYRRRGFQVTMLTLQNEPKAAQPWDSCVFTAQEQKRFLFDYVWPSLVEHNLDDVKIYIWDHNKERALEWAEVILDSATDHMVEGIAFHWYSGDHFESLRLIKERFPHKKLLLSEACIEFSKYSPSNNLANAQKYAHDMIGNLNEGMNTFLDWNLVLDEKGGPNRVKNYCDAPYLFHAAEQRLVERTLQSYIWHFSHFLERGAVRIGASRYTDKLEVTAFCKDHRITFVLLNRTGETLPAYIRIGSRCAGINMAPHSIATGVISI